MTISSDLLWATVTYSFTEDTNYVVSCTWKKCYNTIQYAIVGLFAQLQLSEQLAVTCCANMVAKSSNTITESRDTAILQVGQPSQAIQPKGFVSRFFSYCWLLGKDKTWKYWALKGLINEGRAYLGLLPCTTTISSFYTTGSHSLSNGTGGVTLAPRRLVPSFHCRDENIFSFISFSFPSVAGIFHILVYVLI